MQDDILVFTDKSKPKIVTCHDLMVFSHYFRADDISDLQVSCIGYEDVAHNKPTLKSTEMKKRKLCYILFWTGKAI